MNKGIKSILKYLIKAIQYFIDYLDRSNPKNPEILYEDLTPYDNADSDGTYQKALHWALKNKNIRNIALTGPYGSGKSSVIKTFQKSNKGFQYLNISLATFSDATANSNLLETNILYQIFYYAKPNKISQSRYKRIEILSVWQMIFRSMGLLVTSLALIFLLKPQYLIKIEDVKNFITDFQRDITFICWTILCISFLSISFWMFKAYHNFRLSKLNIAGGEIEGKKDENSILNGHLDEILYFFEVSKYDVVFIEDLDRFKDPVNVFSKLREINLLINNANRVRRNVVFIYALKDELFKDEKRTKFFDFIIPIIPVINSNNAKEMMARKLAKAKLTKHIPKDFVAFIAYYLNDMRMLLNIINELLLYKDKLLKNADLQYQKLLGMIVYKNICAEDFSKLHENEGDVHKFFRNKPLYLKSLQQGLINQRDELENTIELVKDEKLRSLKELRAIYVSRFFDHLVSLSTTTPYPETATGEIEIDSVTYKLENLVADEELFDKFRASTAITYRYHYGHSITPRPINFNFEQLEEKGHGLSTYEERAKIIAMIEKKEEEKLKIMLRDILIEIDRNGHFSIEELLEIIDIEELDTLESTSPIIGYLIRKGYLDERYQNYISLFYPGTLTLDDKNFLLSVQQQMSKPFTHPLTNVHELIEDLSDYDFRHVYVFNHNLMDFLLTEDNEAYDDKLESLFSQISSEDETALRFMLEYLECGRQKDAFLLRLYQNYPRFWDYIQTRSKAVADNKLGFLSIMLNALTIEDLVELNENNSMSEFLQSQPEILDDLIRNGVVEKGLQLMEKLEVKIQHINFLRTNKELIEEIYNRNLYQLSKKLIDGFLSFKLGKTAKGLENLHNAHLTTILSSGEDKLVSYIQQDPGIYVRQVFFLLEDTSGESNASLMYLINNDKVGLDDCEKIIDLHPELTIGRLFAETVPDVFPYFIEKRRVKPDLGNILDYWRGVSLDETIIAFINEKTTHMLLSKQTLTKVDKTELIEFHSELLSSPGISVEALKSLLKTFRTRFKELDLKDQPLENIKAIIQSGKLAFSRQNHDLLINANRKSSILFLEHFKGQVIKRHLELALTPVAYLEIFSSKKFTQQEKINVVLKIDVKIFNAATSSLADKTLMLLTENNETVTFPLLKASIQYTTFVKEKFDLINRYMGSLTPEWITEILIILGSPYNRLINNKANITIENTDYHRKFAELLDSSLKGGKYISSQKPINGGKQIKINAKGNKKTVDPS